jgi:hypothetical protein
MGRSAGFNQNSFDQRAKNRGSKGLAALIFMVIDQKKQRVAKIGYMSRILKLIMKNDDIFNK